MTGPRRKRAFTKAEEQELADLRWAHRRRERLWVVQPFRQLPFLQPLTGGTGTVTLTEAAPLVRYVVETLQSP